MATKNSKTTSKKSSTRSGTRTTQSKTNNTEKKGGTTATAVRKPLVSTGKKIALAVYFTFVGTLMGVLGLQIWMNSMDSNSQLETNPTYQETTQTTEQPNQETSYVEQSNMNEYSSDAPTNDLSNYSNYYNNSGYNNATTISDTNLTESNKSYSNIDSYQS